MADKEQIIKQLEQALDEIDEYCIKDISLTGDLLFRTTASDILDIIRKAKDNNNE